MRAKVTNFQLCNMSKFRRYDVHHGDCDIRIYKKYIFGLHQFLETLQNYKGERLSLFMLMKGLLNPTQG